MTGTVITVKGRSLIAKMIAMNTAVEFTRATVGTGSIPPGYDPAYLTNLNQYQMDGKITAISSENETAYITFQIASRDVEAGFVITEAGLYAVDPDEGEILYAYLNMADDPQYIYKNGGEVNKVAEITLGVIVGQVEKITATIAPDGLVNRKQLEEALDEKVSREEGKGLSSNDFTDECRDKLQGVENGANNYVHPTTHPAEMIVQDPLRRFVSDTEKTAWGETYQQATGYTDQKIAALIGGAPDTLNTLGEISTALKNNPDVVKALEESIGKKANEAEFDSHVKDNNNPHKVTASQVGAVSVSASQELSETQKANARANIGAGTSSFSGNYNDLSNKPSSLPASGGNADTVDGIHLMVVSALPSDAASHPDTLYIIAG